MKHNKFDRSVMQKIFNLQCEICKALAHPLRLAIVDRLNHGEAAASDLIESLEVSKASLSKHMSLLTHGGIVDSRQEGRRLFYRLTDPEIHKACAVMRTIIYRRLKAGERLASALNPLRSNQPKKT